MGGNRRSERYVAAVLLLTFCSLLSAAPPSDAVLAATLARFNASAHTPLPVLSARQREELRAGEVVKLLERTGDGETWRVAGFMMTENSQQAMWLATQDLHFTSQDEAIEAPISLSPNRSRWYALLDLPAPVRDRHWVIDIWDNIPLADVSDGMFWEHRWELVADGEAQARSVIASGAVNGLDIKTFDAAIYTPVNLGGWVFLAFPGGGSLLVYDVTSVVGGGIPDRLVAEYVRSGIERYFRLLEVRARDEVPGHYRSGHEPVIGADGKPVPFYP